MGRRASGSGTGAGSGIADGGVRQDRRDDHHCRAGHHGDHRWAGDHGDNGAPTTTTVAGVPDTGQTYELKMAFHVPGRASIVGAYYQPWADAVAKATNNRVTIKMYAEETLVKEADQYDAVVSGLADIASVTADATPGRFPNAEFYGLPRVVPQR